MKTVPDTGPFQKGGGQQHTLEKAVKSGKLKLMRRCRPDAGGASHEEAHTKPHTAPEGQRPSWGRSNCTSHTGVQKDPNMVDNGSVPEGLTQTKEDKNSPPTI